MDEGRRPLSVGFWFSLGHSSVVFVPALLLSLGVKSLAAPVREDNSELKVYYNLTITGLSVAVALIVGTAELLGLLADKADCTARSGTGSAAWT